MKVKYYIPKRFMAPHPLLFLKSTHYQSLSCMINLLSCISQKNLFVGLLFKVVGKFSKRQFIKNPVIKNDADFLFLLANFFALKVFLP